MSIIISVVLILVVLTAVKESRVVRCPFENENPVFGALIELGLGHEPDYDFEDYEDIARIGGGRESKDLTLEGGNDIEIECSAAYPITWDISRNTPLPRVNIRNRKDYVVDVGSSNRSCYTSTLKVASRDFGVHKDISKTGAYTCKSLDGKRIASQYIFHFDPQNKQIFNIRENLRVHSTLKISGQSEVVIPCRANLANLNASIYRLDENGNPVSLGKDLDAEKYDSKVGFILSGQSNSNLEGKYACSATYKNFNQTVTVTVLPPQSFSVSPETRHVTFHKSAIKVLCSATEPVKIQIQSQNAPDRHLRMKKSSSPFESNSLPYTAEVEISRQFSEQSKGDINCVKKSSGEVLWTWHYDTAYECQCDWEGVDWSGRRGFPRCFSQATGRVNLSYIQCDNPADCEAALKTDPKFYANIPDQDDDDEEIGFVPDVKDSDGNSTTLGLWWGLSGVLKCAAGEYTTTKQITVTLSRDDHYFDELPTDAKLITVRGGEGGALLPGEHVEFDIFYSRFHFAEETAIQWAFTYRNGTIGKPEILNGSQCSLLSYTQIYSYYNQNFVPYITKCFLQIPTTDVTGVTFFLEEWTTRQWRNASTVLRVLSPQPVSVASYDCNFRSRPSITLETVSFPLSTNSNYYSVTNETTLMSYGQYQYIKLTCRAHYPVQWLKKGEKIESNLKMLSCLTIPISAVYEATLTFQPGIHDSGYYNCTKVFDSAVQANTFLYITEELTKSSLVNEDRHIEVVKSSSDPDRWATIPCTVNNPRAMPELAVQREKKNSLKWPQLSKNLRYDPKIGFQVNVETVRDRITTFLCFLEKNRKYYRTIVSLLKLSKLDLTEKTENRTLIA